MLVLWTLMRMHLPDSSATRLCPRAIEGSRRQSRIVEWKEAAYDDVAWCMPYVTLALCIALWLCVCGSRVHMCQVWPALPPRCGMPLAAADSRQQGRLLLLAFALLCLYLECAFLLSFTWFCSELQSYIDENSHRHLCAFFSSERLMLIRRTSRWCARQAMQDHNFISFWFVPYWKIRRRIRM